MRAVRLHAGRTAAVRVDDVPEPPPPNGDQLLLRVAASSVNGTDLGLVRNPVLARAASPRRPLVLGFDVAGEVVAVGPAVTAFAPGDPVVALLPHSGGGHAERVLVRQGGAARAPGSVPLDVAAGLPLAGLTALQALHGVAALHSRRDARVLVVGAAGGIGSFAVQLAALAGATVTAVADARRAEYVRELGAADVLDRDEVDLEVDVAAAGRRFDVVLDAPTALPWAAARRVLAEDGVLVATRLRPQDALRSAAARPLRRRGPRAAAVFTRARSGDLARLVHLVDDGRLRVPVHATHPLADVAAAHRDAGGGVRGKVLVVP